MNIESSTDLTESQSKGRHRSELKRDKAVGVPVADEDRPEAGSQVI